MEAKFSGLMLLHMLTAESGTTQKISPAQ